MQPKDSSHVSVVQAMLSSHLESSCNKETVSRNWGQGVGGAVPDCRCSPRIHHMCRWCRQCCRRTWSRPAAKEPAGVRVSRNWGQGVGGAVPDCRCSPRIHHICRWCRQCCRRTWSRPATRKQSVEIGDREWVGPYRTVGAAQGFITCVGGAGNAVVALGVVLQQSRG